MISHASGFAAASILVALGLLHLYWAAGGQTGKAASIPTRDGRPVLRPTPLAAAFVGIALLAAASIVVAASGLLGPIGAAWAVRACASLLALVFFARAIGDFRYVGFFKSIADSPFARRDTLAFSPLCVGLALLIVIALFRG